MKKNLRIVFMQLEAQYGTDYVFEKAQDYVNQKRWEKQVDDIMHETASHCVSENRCLECKAEYPRCFFISPRDQIIFCICNGYADEEAEEEYEKGNLDN
jgi:hypothetical protein